jgi:hypothetical protein
MKRHPFLEPVLVIHHDLTIGIDTLPIREEKMKSKWPLLLSLLPMVLWLCSCTTTSSSPPSSTSLTSNSGNFGIILTELNLNITEDQRGTPKFSFSDGQTPQTPQITRLDVTQVNDQGMPMQYSWSIECPQKGANTVDAIVYGRVPPGWKQTCRPIPIQNNMFYSINGVKFFCRDSQGGYSIYSRKDFARLQPQSARTPPGK